ncbi:MAG: transporter substrate-binding domain-containing protein, partial [Pseudomonadota bacterium]
TRFVVPRDAPSGSETAREVYGAVFDTPQAAYLTKTYPAAGDVMLYGSAEEMWVDLSLGRLTGALATAVAAQTEFLGTPTGEGFRFSSGTIADASVRARNVSIAVRKGELDLLAQVDEALTALVATQLFTETLSRELGGGLAEAPNLTRGD